jgi:hypothetical protein
MTVYQALVADVGLLHERLPVPCAEELEVGVALVEALLLQWPLLWAELLLQWPVLFTELLLADLVELTAVELETGQVGWSVLVWVMVMHVVSPLAQVTVFVTTWQS